MVYVLDTSSLIVIENYYPDLFPTFWNKLNTLVANGQIISTKEVFREIENINHKSIVLDWAKQHKELFATPSLQELLFVKSIFSVSHFQCLINEKQRLKGTAVADPFVIAAAKVKNGTVVTEEHLKPNAAKIPNVCKHFGIPYTDLEGFMKELKWTF
jgi:hypothetical protein